jgi:hypothetical protein
MSRGKVAAACVVFLTVCVGTVAASAYTTASFGNQSWSNGTETGRYRSSAGYHYIDVACSTSSTLSVELRVDVINYPDISVGYVSRTCSGTNYPLNSTIDSNQVDYRGHFMKSHSGWYGTLSDYHP